jgi:hypothetical protein
VSVDAVTWGVVLVQDEHDGILVSDGAEVSEAVGKIGMAAAGDDRPEEEVAVVGEEATATAIWGLAQEGSPDSRVRIALWS